jgi:hypothetical protein
VYWPIDDDDVTPYKCLIEASIGKHIQASPGHTSSHRATQRQHSPGHGSNIGSIVGKLQDVDYPNVPCTCSQKKQERHSTLLLWVGEQGRPIAVHNHGSASLAPYDGWADDEICSFETKDYVSAQVELLHHCSALCTFCLPSA